MRNLKLLTVCLLISINNISAQENKRVNDSIAEKNFEFSLLPYINYNRTLGGVFVILPMMMYKINPKDSLSPKSITGASVIYSTNKSFGGFFFNKLFFDENKYRAVVILGKGSFNSQFFSENTNAYSDYNSNTFFFKA